MAVLAAAASTLRPHIVHAVVKARNKAPIVNISNYAKRRVIQKILTTKLIEHVQQDVQQDIQ